MRLCQTPAAAATSAAQKEQDEADEAGALLEKEQAEADEAAALVAKERIKNHLIEEISRLKELSGRGRKDLDEGKKKEYEDKIVRYTTYRNEIDGFDSNKLATVEIELSESAREVDGPLQIPIRLKSLI